MEDKRLAAALLVGLAAVCVGTWFLLDLIAATHSAADAFRNEQAMRSLAQEIAELRSFDSSAQLVGEQPNETTQTWVKLASESSIRSEQIVEVNRLPLAAIPDTSYSRDDVFLKIRGVPLQALVDFLIRCRDRESGYTPASVHVIGNSIASRGVASEQAETWDASLVLTRILYTATSKK